MNFSKWVLKKPSLYVFLIGAIISCPFLPHYTNFGYVLIVLSLVMAIGGL